MCVCGDYFFCIGAEIRSIGEVCMHERYTRERLMSHFQCDTARCTVLRKSARPQSVKESSFNSE